MRVGKISSKYRCLPPTGEPREFSKGDRNTASMFHLIIARALSMQHKEEERVFWYGERRLGTDFVLRRVNNAIYSRLEKRKAWHP